MTTLVVVDGRFESDLTKRVMKYRLPLLPDPTEMDVPVGATLLHAEFVQLDPVDGYKGHWLLWYEVPLDAKVEKARVFQSMATGVHMPKCAKHLKTAVTRDHSYAAPKPMEVWHLYEYPSGAKVRLV